MAVMSRRTFLASAAVLSVVPQIHASVPELPALTWHPASPVLKPDQPWEGTFAAPFSGGIWRVNGQWCCYYLAGPSLDLCMAISDDGITWLKPPLRDMINRVIADLPSPHDSTGVWYRDGLWTCACSSGADVHLYQSEDGLSFRHVGKTGAAADRTTFWHDGTGYVWGVRAGMGIASDPRRTDYMRSASFVPETWTPERWLAADAGDPHDEAYSGGAPQLYAVDVVPYEDVFLGLATIWRGQRRDRPKLNDVTLMVSRNGREFLRPWRQPWLSRSDVPQTWNFGNVQSVGHGVHVVNDTVYVYASGRAGEPGTAKNGVVSMGLATVQKATFDAAIRGVLRHAL